MKLRSLIVLTAVSLAMLGGCVKRRSDTGTTVYSADGARRAYVTIKEKSVGKGPMDYRGSLHWETTRSVHVLWRNQFGVPHKFPLDLDEPLEAEESLDADRMLRVAFSPNGRHIAAVARRKIWILDTRGGGQREITEGLADVVSFAWLSDAAIGFASQVRTEDSDNALYSPHHRYHVSFWRCDVADDLSRPKLLLRLRNVEHRVPGRSTGRPDAPHHEWKDDGRIVDRDSGKTVVDLRKLPGTPQGSQP